MVARKTLDRAAALGQVERLLALGGQVVHLEAQAQHRAGVLRGAATLDDHQAEEDEHADAQVGRHVVTAYELQRQRRQHHRQREGDHRAKAHRQHHQPDRGDRDDGGRHHHRQYRVLERQHEHAEQAVDETVDRQHDLEAAAPEQRGFGSGAVVAAGDDHPHHRGQHLGGQPGQQQSLIHRVPQQPADQHAHRHAQRVGAARAVEGHGRLLATDELVDGGGRSSRQRGGVARGRVHRIEGRRRARVELYRRGRGAT
jgi:hypothetical protein